MVRKAIDYGLSIVGAPYVWWTDGPVPDRSPAWAENAPPPPPEEVINEGCFCAGVPNLMLRVVGGELPTLGNELYDGGCLAYGEYYYNVAEPFDINEDYPPGTLIGRYFTWERSANGDQGHVAVVLEDGYLLQSYDGDGYGYPGVNAATHIVDSHAGYYYEYAVRPENWIGLDEDEGEDWDGYEDSGSTVPGDGSLLTADYLVAIMPNNLPYERAEYLLPYLTAALEEFEINTGSRVAMFLANVAVETGEFQWFQELDSWDGTYLVNKPYYPYYGRGVIHLTWQENYAAAGDYFGEDLVSYPDRAADVDLAFRIAGWFWRYWSAQGDLNVAADNGDFDTTCLGVNGGWNGYQERCAYYDAACQVLGV